MFFIGIVITTIAYEEDEYYCKSTAEYQICRRCKDLTEDCETPKSEEGCRCGNIALFNEGQEEKVGGPNCKLEDPDAEAKVCYVPETSNCGDKEESIQGGLIEDKWINSRIFYSYEACAEKNQQKKEATGNQKEMRGIRIVKDNLEALEEAGRNASGVILKSVPYYIWAESQTDCQNACKDRCETCGAWSYDDTEGKCFLHNVSACCGQLEKQEESENWISGYICNQCWSTRNDCPCNSVERSKGCDGSTAFSSGAQKTDKNTPTGELSIHKTIQNIDVCEAIPFKGRKGLIKSRKPKCLMPRDRQLWKISDEKFLINKAGAWTMNDNWNIPAENKTGKIENAITNNVLGIFEKGDGLQLVVEEPLMPKNSKQLWTRGKTDDKGFFTLTSPESDSKKVLTGTLIENGKDQDGDPMSEPSLFLLEVGCQDEKRCRSFNLKRPKSPLSKKKDRPVLNI